MSTTNFKTFCLSVLLITNILASVSKSSREISKEYDEVKKDIEKIINDKHVKIGTFDSHMKSLNISINKMKTLEREASCRNDSKLANNIKGSVKIYGKVADKFNQNKYNDSKK
ncbi:hypothetical protein P3W45_001440 [Vairimorpha bombi]